MVLVSMKFPNAFNRKIAYHNGISTFIHGSIRDNFNFYGVFDNNTIVHLTKLCCPSLLISKETLDDTLITDIAASTGENKSYSSL